MAEQILGDPGALEGRLCAFTPASLSCPPIAGEGSQAHLVSIFTQRPRPPRALCRATWVLGMYRFPSVLDSAQRPRD